MRHEDEYNLVDADHAHWTADDFLPGVIDRLRKSKRY